MSVDPGFLCAVVWGSFASGTAVGYLLAAILNTPRRHR